MNHARSLSAAVFGRAVRSLHFSVDDLVRALLGSGRLPQLLGNGEWIDPSRLPPQRFIARAMELAVVKAAQRNREFVADLAPEGEFLGEAQVVRLGGLTPTNQA